MSMTRSSPGRPIDAAQEARLDKTMDSRQDGPRAIRQDDERDRRFRLEIALARTLKLGQNKPKRRGARRRWRRSCGPPRHRALDAQRVSDPTARLAIFDCDGLGRQPGQYLRAVKKR